MRKKALSMILAATVCLQLVGCGGSSTSSQSNGGDTTAADSGSDQADTQAESGDDSAAASSEGGSDELVDGKFEIQLVRELIPATWSDTEFGIGFDVQQNWSSVGILPNAPVTDENPAGKAHKIQVKINK